MTTELHLLQASDFIPYLHHELSVKFTREVSVAAEVIEVRETTNYTLAERTPFFFVLRTAGKDPFYPQGIYTVEHPEKGDLPVFLVPIGPDGKGMRYEAVFS